MSLASELDAITARMPPGSAVTLPVDFLRSLLDQDAGKPGGRDRLLTLDELAQVTGRATSTLRTWCNTGKITGAFRLHGREWRVPESAWERYLEGLKMGEATLERVHPEGSVDLGSWRRVRGG